MANTSPLAPLLLKGAFIRLDETAIGAVPQIIVFQYNPESLSRKFKPYEAPAKDKAGEKPDPSARAAPYDPEEEMDIAVEFDATDDLEQPESHPIAVLAGVADRIAALEMLMYPSDELGLLSSAISSLAGALGLGGGGVEIPKDREVPVVLLTWGPGRVVPVKITSFSVEEQAFNPALYPIRAKVTVGVKVLTEDYFNSRTESKQLTSAEAMAQTAYRYTFKQKKTLAAANVANNLDSILSTLPF
jgi:hypothetical protein